MVAPIVRQEVIAGELRGSVEVLEDESVAAILLQIFNTPIDRARKFLLQGSAPIQESGLAQQILVYKEVRDQWRAGKRGPESVVIVIKARTSHSTCEVIEMCALVIDPDSCRNLRVVLRSQHVCPGDARRVQRTPHDLVPIEAHTWLYEQAIVR